MSTAPKSLITPAESLEIERKSSIKHEFYRGEMLVRAGASRQHNLITANLSRLLGNQLRDRPCELYVSDMRVRVEATCLYTYPDVVVACGDPDFEDSHVDTLLNPTLIVEVLSPSTESYDRGKKFAQYRLLESLLEYIVVSQELCMVEVYARRGEQWVLTARSNPESWVAFESIGCEVALSEIYARVEFPPPQPPPEDCPR